MNIKVRNFTSLPALRFLAFVMYYVYGSVRAIPTYRVYRLYDRYSKFAIMLLLYSGLAQAHPELLCWLLYLSVCVTWVSPAVWMERHAIRVCNEVKVKYGCYRWSEWLVTLFWYHCTCRGHGLMALTASVPIPSWNYWLTLYVRSSIVSCSLDRPKLKAWMYVNSTHFETE